MAVMKALASLMERCCLYTSCSLALLPLSSKTSLEGSDPTCVTAEVILQKLVEFQCGVSEVSCVYKMDGDCDDWRRRDNHSQSSSTVCMPRFIKDATCKPSTQCGYIQDNAFMKFHDFDCSITATSVFPPRVDGTIKCKPSFTTAGILVILAAVVLGLSCCGGCTWWCCCRSRRR
ncbi:unnamed protein product [Prorocentrum cordatum]|uniref:Uncharacterized protein n=1 Tax=Prorocentrum cordatum TaxID=2364126 RepID=A0ABN9VDR0_9DINO|nr:unnamed protein product [Polarella glacialis]